VKSLLWMKIATERRALRSYRCNVLLRSRFWHHLFVAHSLCEKISQNESLFSAQKQNTNELQSLFAIASTKISICIAIITSETRISRLTSCQGNEGAGGWGHRAGNSIAGKDSVQSLAGLQDVFLALELRLAHFAEFEQTIF